MKINSNNIEDINKALRTLSKQACSAVEILYTEVNPTGEVEGCYKIAINSLTGDISYKDDNREWQLIPGSGGTQTLQQTLTQGNTANLPIFLTDDLAKVVVSDTTGDNITTIDSNQVSIQNSTGFAAQLRASNPTSNIVAEFQDASGVLAYLSDIASGSTPMTINTKIADYTLQLIDGDNNSLVEMNMGVANNITLDNSIAFPIGTSIMVSSKGAGQTTVVAAGGAVIHTPNAVSTVLTHQDSMGVLIKRDATNWYFSGDIGPDTGSGSVPPSIVYKSANYTIDPNTDYTVVCHTNSFDIQLPAVAGIEGQVFNIKNVQPGEIILVNGDGAELIDSASSVPVKEGENLQIQATSSGWIIL